jgi:hypothetical protein
MWKNIKRLKICPLALGGGEGRIKRNAFLENPRKRRANDTIVGAVIAV